MANSAFTTGSGGSGGGSTTKLLSQTASSSANISFTNLSSAYSLYTISFYNVYLSVVDNLQLLTSANNGSSYDEGSGDYRWAEYGSIDGSFYHASDDAFGNTFIPFTDSFSGYSIANNPTQGICGYINIYNPSASAPTQMQFSAGGLFYLNPSNIWAGNFTCFGMRTAAAPVNAIQISPYLNTTLIAGGTFNLYGTI